MRTDDALYIFEVAYEHQQTKIKIRDKNKYGHLIVY